MEATALVLRSIITFILIGVSIYTLILLIMLAHRGIKALDIYINEKRNRNL